MTSQGFRRKGMVNLSKSSSASPPGLASNCQVQGKRRKHRVSESRSSKDTGPSALHLGHLRKPCMSMSLLSSFHAATQHATEHRSCQVHACVKSKAEKTARHARGLYSAQVSAFTPHLAPQGGDSERILKMYASLTRPTRTSAHSLRRVCLVSPLDVLLLKLFLT